MGYDLLDEPWIPLVAANGRHDMTSLRGLAAHPADYLRLDVADPLERMGLLRMLLAIVRAAHPHGIDPDTARHLIDDGHDPDLARYLDDREGLFDPTDPDRPFLQTAGMEPAGRPADTGLSRLHPSMQRNVWRTRDPHEPVDPGRATLLLLACRNYGVAGIQTGMRDDPAARAGKRMSQGVGQAGGLALATIRGGNLWATLLLNATAGETGTPAWDHTPADPFDDTDRPDRTGTPWSLTHPARRIRLLWNRDGLCEGAHVTYGIRPDLTHPGQEPNAFWTHAGGKDPTPRPVNITFGPLADRPLWTMWERAFIDQDGDAHHPATFRPAFDILDTDAITFDTLAVRYGAQSSTMERVRTDAMTLHRGRLDDPDATLRTIQRAIRRAWPAATDPANDPRDAWAGATRTIDAYLAGGKEPE